MQDLSFIDQSARCIINKLNEQMSNALQLSLKKIGVFVNAEENVHYGSG